MGEEIRTTVGIYINDITLTVWTTKKFKAEDGGNFGYIEIGGNLSPDENCFWDGIDFFIDMSRKEFKKECKEELESKGYEVESTYKDIKRLVKRAAKLKIITV